MRGVAGAIERPHAHELQTTNQQKIMATLQELCTAMPVQLKREAVQRELLRRKNEGYCRRMLALDDEQNIFATCKGVRQPKRFKNYASTEQAGRVGYRLKDVRTSGSRTIVVCKTRNLF